MEDAETTEIEPDAEGAARSSVQSVDRAITVLQILARTGGAGVSEIAEEMGVHKSTASRLLSALDAREMAQQNHERGKYQLGFEILRLASSIPGRLSVAYEARPFLKRPGAQVPGDGKPGRAAVHFCCECGSGHGVLQPGHLRLDR